MTDVREQILLRLVDCLGAMSGIKTTHRDRREIPDDLLPAALLLDGSEKTVSEIEPLKSVRMPPAIVLLSPQIFILPRPRDNPDNLTLDQKANPIGPELTMWLNLSQATIENDPILLGILGQTGQIIYRGHDTDMATGRSIVGQLQLHYDFAYVRMPTRS